VGWHGENDVALTGFHDSIAGQVIDRWSGKFAVDQCLEDFQAAHAIPHVLTEDLAKRGPLPGVQLR
jgi:hypothetical protein